MALSRIDPVGREPELERLREALDDLERGGNPCIAVEGEPGIGKTWLLSELRRRAEERGHLVLAGAAAEFERDLPFGVWVDALDAYVAAQEFDAEPLTTVLGSTGPGSGDERHRVHRALRALLEEIAERRPLVLILDDLHWSDPASIEVLTALLRRGTTARVLLALGFRSGKAPAKLIAALAGATIIDLGPLSETDCARLVGAGHDAAAIYAQSGGNPFYTLQLAQATELPSRSSSGDRLARDAGVPRVVAATIVEQLESLTPDARTLVNAGAIAGDPFEPELAYAIASLASAGLAGRLPEIAEWVVHRKH
jgi:predicted ATPase